MILGAAECADIVGYFFRRVPMFSGDHPRARHDQFQPRRGPKRMTAMSSSPHFSQN
jgi:hypothetical protein